MLTRRELEPLIDALKGKSAGWRRVAQALRQNPCAVYPRPKGDPRPLAYRLTGPLHPKVCGAHLNNGYRVAFTMRPPDREDIEGIVDVIYIGTRNTRQREFDIWHIVHDIFGLENPKEGHLRSPCCDDDYPHMDEGEIHEFMDRLHHQLRGR